MYTLEQHLQNQYFSRDTTMYTPILVHTGFVHLSTKKHPQKQDTQILFHKNSSPSDLYTLTLSSAYSSISLTQIHTYGGLEPSGDRQPRPLAGLLAGCIVSSP